MSTATTTPLKSALPWVLAIVVLIGTAGWFAVSCGADQASVERPVNEEEAQLLAALRYRNHTAAPVAVRMEFPVDGESLTAEGYLDWGASLLYARTPGADGADQLVQAIPGLVATHADDEAFDEVAAPGSEWSTRQMMSGETTPAQTAFEVLASTLFTLSAAKDDDAGHLIDNATWREDGVIDGDRVNTFRAPIMVESADAAAASPEALYTLDGSGDLRRFQVNTGDDELATVDFLYDAEFSADDLRPIDLLGGPAIAPDEVDGELAETIAQLRHANWSQSATVSMDVPLDTGQVAQVEGSVDWRTMTAYLNVTDTDGHRLMLARPGGLASVDTESDELPETPPEEGWETRAFGDEQTSEEFGPVETLAYRLLEMSAPEPDDVDLIAEEASQLRVDEAEGQRVHVVEFPVAGDAQAEAGQSAFRYHVADERLTEVEMMTEFGVAGAELTYEDFPMVTVPWSVAETIG